MKVIALSLIALFAALTHAEEKKVVCYVGTWASYRISNGKFDVENIDPSLCTHLMYAFFGIELSGDIRVIDPYLDLEENWGRGNIKKFNALKNTHPNLKTLAVVGGANEGSLKFSQVAKSPITRRRFVETSRDFLLKHKFDGLDLSWNYPGRNGGDIQVDKQNHAVLLKELKEEFSKHGLLLSVGVSCTENASKVSYDIPEISKHVEFINVMCYDLHGSWDPVVGMNAPLHPTAYDTTPSQLQLNVDAGIQFWLQSGAPSEKIVLGLPSYGRTFTIADPSNPSVGSPSLGAGISGKYSQAPGFIGYNELCEFHFQGDWTLEWEDNSKVSYMHKGNQWISYDDPKSVQFKAEYANLHKLGGVMVWSLETDDFRGLCGEGAYPLLKTISNIIR